jgi:hypothetical protein
MNERKLTEIRKSGDRDFPTSGVRTWTTAVIGLLTLVPGVGVAER